MIRRAGQLVPIKINGEKGEGPELVKKYAIEGFPAILFLNSSGEKVHEILGYLPATEFAPEMDAAMAKL